MNIISDEMASSENTSLLGKLITLKFYADRMFDPDNNQWANSAGDFVFFSRFVFLFSLTFSSE